MYIRSIISLLLLLSGIFSFGQQETDVSLYYKNNPDQQLPAVESKRGNLYHKLGHHGPAIENPWFGLRLYFSKKTAIDVYSKAEKQLELKEAHWYPSKEQQAGGWGADYYMVGNTVGLGGVKLWDNDRIVDLHPVSKRMASVVNAGDSAYMDMISEGVKYKGKKVDIKVRVTVYADTRLAKVMAESMTGDKVQFVSGINFHDDLEIKQTDKYLATWGIHPEDVAAAKVAVGAALMIPENGIREVRKIKDQFILISEPTTHLTLNITSANEREQKINTFQKFTGKVESLLNTP